MSQLSRSGWKQFLATRPVVLGALLLLASLLAFAPFAPLLPGTELDGVLYLRTIDDAESLAQRVAAAGLSSPALTIVGEVVRLREVLDWYAAQPLAAPPRELSAAFA